MTRSKTIGIDASRLNITERTGTETYTYQLLTALARLPIDDRFRLYFNARPGSFEPPLGDAVFLPFPRFWTHARLSWEMIRHAPDVLFVPAHVVPMKHPKTVVTIHDLGYLYESTSHPRRQRTMLDLTTRWSCLAAQHIIAISNATKHDLQKFYDVPADRIRVIPHGVDPIFQPDPTETDEHIKQKYHLPDKYILAVGTIQPRKNHGRLAAAMLAIDRAGLPHRLVIAGKRGWLADHVDESIAKSGMANHIQFIGYVPQTDLPALFRGASLFCFPSLYEGFGLPALEAMASGIPTIVSDRGALPEIVGTGAVIVDPLDTKTLGSTMVELLTDQAEQKRLVARGFTQAKNFTWEQCARETLALLRSVRDGTAH